jgi:hypothetical protein
MIQMVTVNGNENNNVTQMLSQQILSQQKLSQQKLSQQMLSQQMLSQQMLSQQMLSQQMLPQQIKLKLQMYIKAIFFIKMQVLLKCCQNKCC